MSVADRSTATRSACPSRRRKRGSSGCACSRSCSPCSRLAAVSFAFGLFVSIACRPSVADPLRAVQGRAQLRAPRRPWTPDRRAQPADRVIVTPAQIPRDRQGGGDLDRGQALLDATAASTSAASPAQSRRHHARQQPSRAPRRSSSSSSRTRSAGAVAPDDLREAPRGRARLPALRTSGPKHKILAAYLNTIYFGNGAYGIEAAAQTYFGHEVNHQGCGTARPPSVRRRTRALGGGAARRHHPVTRPPTTRSTSPSQAKERRNIVLEQMLPAGLHHAVRVRTHIAPGAPGADGDPGRLSCRPSKASMPATSRAGSSSR